MNDLVRKATGKSVPEKDGTLYKVYRHCNHLWKKLFDLLWQPWCKETLAEGWCKAEAIYLAKEANAKTIKQFKMIAILNVDVRFWWECSQRDQQHISRIIDMVMNLFKRPISLGSLDALNTVIRFGKQSKMPNRTRQVWTWYGST